MICWTGRHYLTIMRVILGESQRKEWVLMNDTQIKHFENWLEVVNFLLDSGCCPTVLIYERQILTEAVEVNEMRARRSMLTDD